MNKKDLAKKILDMKSAEEAAAFLKENGRDVTEGEAQKLLDELHEKTKELSIDELDAVTGGADRDYIKNGCAATVEAGSSCWSNDACSLISVTYDNMPTEHKCPDCGGILCYWDQVWVGLDNRARYNCASCGEFFIEDALNGKFIRIR